VGSTLTTGSSSFATNLVGSVISSTRSFGVGKRTSKRSICASHPHDLNCASIHSAPSLLYGDPTCRGRAASFCMFARMFSGFGIARNFSSQDWDCANVEIAAATASAIAQIIFCIAEDSIPY
jgi:hypothetical protein